jgi:sugar phosphate isomerase/epimerase
MNIAASTLFCLHKPLEEALNDLIEMKIPRIEIADSGYHSLDPKRVQLLQDFKKAYDLEYSIHAPYADTNLSADDDQIRKAILDRLKRSITYAAELEAQALVIHPGRRTAVDRFDPKRTWNLNISSAREILDYARNHGVNAIFENLPEPEPHLMKSVEEFKKFLDSMGKNSGMVLDIAHANTGKEIHDFIETFKDNIGHIHVSDNYGEADRHLEIGVGGINWVKVINHLKTIDFDNWIVVESYRGIPESIEYLRTLI